jgi:hypothetical protein
VGCLQRRECKTAVLGLCTDGDGKDHTQALQRYLVAGIEFNKGGLFPLGETELLHHRGVLCGSPNFAAGSRRP